MTDLPLMILLRLYGSLAQRLSEGTSSSGGCDRSDLCQILNFMVASQPAFERVAAAFNTAEEAQDEDLCVVQAVFEARVLLDCALDRFADDALDGLAKTTDDALAPFADALHMLDPAWLVSRTLFVALSVDPDTWWGSFNRSFGFQQTLEQTLIELLEQTLQARLVLLGVSPERAAHCLKLAERHLNKQYVARVMRSDRGRPLVARHEKDSRACILWSQHGHPRPHRVFALAVKLSRKSDEQLDRFQQYLEGPCQTSR
jgi:hypothetical protein